MLPNTQLHDILEKLSRQSGSTLRFEQKKKLARQLQCHCLDSYVISVTGTNGKGSVVAALEAILHQAGVRVASFTSPHLLSVCERIRYQQEMIDENRLYHLLQQVLAHYQFDYFSALFFAAIYYFQAIKPEVVILEAGIGGAEDVTNVIDADLVIITTVDYDHCDVLGDSLEQIASQKAGLMRQNKPVIYADQLCPKAIVLRAKALNAVLYQLDQDYRFNIQDGSLHWQSLNRELMIDEPSLHPKTVACAIMASLLLPFTIADADIVQALHHLTLAGRMHCITDDSIKVVCDVAHNPQAIDSLLNRLQIDKKATQTIIICTFKKDKLLAPCLSRLSELTDKWYLCDIDDQRMLTKEALARQLKSDSDIKLFASPQQAYRQAKTDLAPGSMILVLGSFTIVAEVLRMLNVNEEINSGLQD